MRVSWLVGILENFKFIIWDVFGCLVVFFGEEGCDVNVIYLFYC